MIGAITPVGSYTGIQHYTKTEPLAARGSSGLPEKISRISARKPSDINVPVQPIKGSPVVTAGASGNMPAVDLTVRGDAEAAELSARMRMTSAEDQSAEDSAAIVPGTEENPAKQEQIQAQQEAEEKREAYLEAQREEQEARAERIEALKEAQEESEAEEVPAEEEVQTGSLQLDYTAAMLQNYQMNTLLKGQIAARAEGKDTSAYSAAIDALLEMGQSRVRFTTEKNEPSDARRYYQQQVNRAESAFGAVA